jgi:RNA polymerase sigma-54 factor
MALGPRLDIRQSQSLVMTPQLQQAIKLLALSNLEVETFIGEALDANPLLEIGETAPAAPARRGDEGAAPPRIKPGGPVVGEGAPPKTARSTSIPPRWTWTATPATAPPRWPMPPRRACAKTGSAGEAAVGAARADIDERGAGGPAWPSISTPRSGDDADPRAVRCPLADRPARRDRLLAHALPEVAETLALPLASVEQALALVQTLDPTGVGARSWANASRSRRARRIATTR